MVPDVLPSEAVMPSRSFDDWSKYDGHHEAQQCGFNHLRILRGSTAEIARPFHTQDADYSITQDVLNTNLLII